MTVLVLRPYLRKSDDRLHLLAQGELYLLLLAGAFQGSIPTVATNLVLIFFALQVMCSNRCLSRTRPTTSS